MPTLAEYYEEFKEKKISAVVASRAWSNFPHRLGTVQLSGSINYIIDERGFTSYSNPSDGSIAFKYEATLDMSLVSPWNRVFLTKIPSLISEPESLGLRDFSLSHTPQYPWRAYYGWDFDTYDYDYKNVGNIVVTEYTYSTTSNSWSVTNTSSSTVECDLFLYMDEGGDSLSGGNDGVSACNISANFSYIGDDAGWLNGLGNADFGRLPWDGTWAPESTAFSDSFAERLSLFNSLDGGGYSGTCSMSMVFTNV